MRKCRLRQGGCFARDRSASHCRSCLSKLGPWSGYRQLPRKSPRNLVLYDNGSHRLTSHGFCGSGVWEGLGRGICSWTFTLSQTQMVAGAGKASHSLRPPPAKSSQAFPTWGSLTAWRPQGSHVLSMAAQGLQGQVNSRDNLESELPFKTKQWRSHDITRSSPDICVWPRSQKSPHTSKQTGRRRPPLSQKRGESEASFEGNPRRKPRPGRRLENTVCPNARPGPARPVPAALTAVRGLKQQTWIFSVWRLKSKVKVAAALVSGEDSLFGLRWPPPRCDPP